jgi:hypothetical protein
MSKSKKKATSVAELQEPENKATALAEAPPAAEAQQTAPTAPETAKKKPGTRRLRELIIENLDITLADMKTQLAAEGYTLSEATLAGFYSDTKATLKVAKEMGKYL